MNKDELTRRVDDFDREVQEVVFAAHEGLIEHREAEREVVELTHLSEVARAMARDAGR